MMKSIILLTINGHMYYINNTFSLDQQHQLEEISKHIQKQFTLGSCTNEEEVFHQFVSTVSQQLNLDIEQLCVSTVLRINI